MGVVTGQLVITEKDNGVIETVNLLSDGAVSGLPKLVQNIPSSPNTPFGLVTRGDDAYVTIAHSNEITLVRDGKVLTVTGSGSQSAPCWLTLVGPFLFSSNSPSLSMSRYAVYGQKDRAGRRCSGEPERRSDRYRFGRRIGSGDRFAERGLASFHLQR